MFGQDLELLDSETAVTLCILAEAGCTVQEARAYMATRRKEEEMKWNN
jgi:hypothetical protein